MSIEVPESKRPIEESREIKERGPGFDLDFYVTDHSADSEGTGNPEKLKELYTDIKKDGIQSVRYDWHWRNIEPQQGKFSEEHLERYGRAKEIMSEAGLESPTIILSNPPAWAVELYKKDKEKFFEEYRGYVKEIEGMLRTTGGGKVERVQILNELNNPVFTPIAAEDIPRMCEITREVLHEYNSDLKLMATLHAGNVGETAARAGFGTPLKEYLKKLKNMKDSFNIVAIDYYPGLWHLPMKEAGWSYKDVFKQLALLKETFEEVATWGKEYELGEVGRPTNGPWSDEKQQRYFFDVFFRAFKHLLLDFRSRGVKLPSRIGVYEAIDEPPKTFLGKILRKTPFPEHDLGMRRSDGGRKMILQGGRHVAEGESRGPAQFQRIISYLRAPMEKK